MRSHRSEQRFGQRFVGVHDIAGGEVVVRDPVVTYRRLDHRQVSSGDAGTESAGKVQDHEP